MTRRTKAKCSVKTYFRSSLEMNHVGLMEQRMGEGKILWWMYRPFVMNLGQLGSYEPSFLSLGRDGSLTCETLYVRGSSEDQKDIQVAACQYHFFKFKLFKYSGHGLESCEVECDEINNKGVYKNTEYNKYANDLERDYASHLGMLKIAGQIHEPMYEPLKLRLAGRTTYTPDFMYMNDDGQIHIDETKGHWEEDARVKIKVAAEIHPYLRFRSVQKKHSSWVWEQFNQKGKFVTEVPANVQSTK